jgi:cell division protein FtsQ
VAERARPADASVRLAQRRRQRLLLRLRRVLVAVLVVAALAGGVWVVGFSQAFAVTKVSVTGASVLTPEQVTAVARVPIGTPLVRLDVKAIEKRIASLKPVAAVSVTRSLPNRVTIAITERQPVYAVSAGSSFDLVDSSGVPYTSVTDVPAGLLVANISGGSDRLRKDVATVATAMPKVLRDKAVLVNAASPDSIVIELRGGAEVVWGSAEKSDEKATVIAALLSISASVYDVSSPSHPTTKA